MLLLFRRAPAPRHPHPRRDHPTRARTRPGALALAAALAVTGALGTLAIAPAASAEPASRGKASSPGDLVSAQPTTFRTAPGAPATASAWNVHYRSTSATGRPNIVSGTVIVPNDGKQGQRPLVTYAVGTVGMGDGCAPSANFPQGTAAEAPLIDGALQRGWAVAVTDYEGLGTPGTHTYTVGRAAGTAVLDVARAAQRLPQARALGVSKDSAVGIMGYSQGGQASGWAAQLHRGYAPELKVKGTASGGVPADLEKVAAYNETAGDRDAALVLMSAIGHDAAYPRLRLNRYLNAEGRRLSAYMRDHCVAENVAAGAGKTVHDVTVVDPLTRPDWQRSVRRDRLGGTAPDQPVYVYHGQSDEIVPYAVGEGLRADWCARGVPVDWHPYPLQNHVGTAVAGSGDAMNWIGQRLAGQPTAGTCGQ